MLTLVTGPRGGLLLALYKVAPPCLGAASNVQGDTLSFRVTQLLSFHSRDPARARPGPGQLLLWAAPRSAAVVTLSARGRGA